MCVHLLCRARVAEALGRIAVLGLASTSRAIAITLRPTPPERRVPERSVPTAHGQAPPALPASALTSGARVAIRACPSHRAGQCSRSAVVMHRETTVCETRNLRAAFRASVAWVGRLPPIAPSACSKRAPGARCEDERTCRRAAHARTRLQTARDAFARARQRIPN